MKKKIIFLIICLFLIVGCNMEDNNPDIFEERILTCTKNIDSSDIPMLQTAIIRFINGRIDGINSNILVTLSDSYQSSIDMFVKSFYDSYKEKFSNNASAEVTVSKNGESEILIDIILDYKNMTEEEKKNSGFYGSEDYNINKTQLEESGYTCK